MSAITSFSQAATILASFVPTDENPRYTLERMKRLMAFLGNPQNNLSVIHVAGTSGKTSTSYYLAALLHSTGRKVGLSISPHIDVVAERAQINMQNLKESDYCEHLSIFLELVEKSGIHPSYFEIMVAFMYWLFDQKSVDYAVVEVGLGGLLDATNVIERSDKICVITDIGYDHIEVLGDTLEKIATQKAGIILPGNRVFMHEQPDEVMDVIKAVCKQRSAELTVVGNTSSLLESHHYIALPEFQKRNIDLAYEVTRQVFTSPEDQKLLQSHLEDTFSTYIPARMEQASWQGKTVIMDGSHNEQKISALVTAVKQTYNNSPISLVVSFGENKTTSLQANVHLLRSLSSSVVITQFSIGQDEIRRPIDPEIIRAAAEKEGFKTIIIEDDPRRALDTAAELSEDTILVTGSFYLMNHIRPIVLKNKKRAS